jgi:hypothetical protein
MVGTNKWKPLIPNILCGCKHFTTLLSITPGEKEGDEIFTFAPATKTKIEQHEIILELILEHRRIHDNL